MRRSLSTLTTTMVVVACLFGLWELAPDIRYAFEGEARDLGTGAELVSGTVPSDRHVRVEGRVTFAASADYRGEKRQLVMLADAPVAILLPPSDEEKLGDEVDASGRIYRADRLSSIYAGNAWTPFAAKKNVPIDRLYVLIAGLEPAVPWKAIAWGALFTALLMFSAYRLARALRSRRAPRDDEEIESP